MRRAVLLAVLLLGACAVDNERYDPRLYDADGNVIPPLASVAPPVQDCREIARKVTIDGAEQSVYATACRQADGTWRFTN